MTYTEKARKTVEAIVAKAMPGSTVTVIGRMKCPVCETHTMSYDVTPQKPTWVACSNFECPLTCEQRAAHTANPWGT